MFPLSKLKKRLRFKENRIEKALHSLEELNVFEKNKAQCFVLQSVHEGKHNHV
ncbi:hypothetical protein COMNV_00923 [Commensalibacter sp. Nvir]|nr:hypothetical protein COMNV_00923 [Commensalibacter sp. Nvir]